MTGWQTLLPRLRGSGGGGGNEAPQDPEERWRQASAPARAARIVLRAAGIDPPPSWIPFLTNATHWGYGTAWGGVYGLLARKRGGSHPVPEGLGFGLGVWAASYAQLVPLGVYSPPWEYDAATLAADASYHVVYGVGVAGAFAALD
jgi:hypothetical protein